MAAARKSRARGGKSGRKRHTVGKYSHWLSTGAVTVALGAAVASGGGIVTATPAWADDSSESAAAESDSTSSKTDADPGPSNVPNGAPAGDAEPKSEPPVATVSAATVEIHEDDKAKKRADVAEDLGADTAHGDDDEEIVADPIAADPDQAGVSVELPQLTTPPTPAQKHAHEANDPLGVSATIVYSADADQGSQPPASDQRSSAMALSNHLRAPDATAPPTTRSLETTPSVPTSLLSAAVAPMPVTSPVTLRSIVTDLLNWFGFTTFARTHPVPALPVPRIVEVLWLAVRRFSHTFTNQAPIVSPTLNTPNPTTGVVTGSLNATDYDGDNLTYSAVGVPGKGTLAVDAAGNFTYTPTSLARIAAGDVDGTLADATDTFTITASDGSLTATARIGVPITPVDAIAIDLPSGTFGGITGRPVFDSRGVAYLQLGPTIKQTRPDGTLSVRSWVAQINPTTGEAVAYEVPDQLIGDIVIGPNGTAYQATKNSLLTFTPTGLTTTALPSGTFGGITTAPLFDSRGVAYLQLGPTIKQTRPDGTLSVRSWVAQINPTTGEAVAYEVPDQLIGDIVIGPNGVAYQATKNSLLTFTPTGLTTTALPSGTFGGITTAPLFDEGGVAYLQLGPTITQQLPDGSIRTRSWVAELNPSTGKSVVHEIFDRLIGDVVIGPDGVAYQPTGRSLWILGAPSVALVHV